MRNLILSLIILFAGFNLLAQEQGSNKIDFWTKKKTDKQLNEKKEEEVEVDEEVEVKKTSFIKQLDLVLGGSLSILETDNAHITDFTNNLFIQNPFFVNSNTTYITKSDFFNPQIYAGIKIGKHFLVGAEYEFSDSKNIVDYGPLFGPGTTYVISRTNRADRKSIFMRYYIPISKRFEFGLQPYASLLDITSDYEINVSTTSSSSIQQERETFNFLELGLSANVIFKVYDRFNIVVQFGNTSFRTGEWEATTSSWANGVKNEEETFRNGELESFDFNFNRSSVFFGLEIIL